MNPSKIWFPIFLSTLFLFPVLGGAEEKPEVASGLSEEVLEGPPSPEITYSFTQSLPEARVIRHRDHKKSEAEWKEGHFRFIEAPGIADVYVAENFIVTGSVREAIAIQIQPGFDTTLIFSRVPPGKGLKIFLAIPDYALKKEKAVPADFEIWIGKKKILDTQVSAKGWKQERADLGLPFLLQRSYVFTVKAHSTDAESKTVLFYGYIE